METIFVVYEGRLSFHDSWHGANAEAVHAGGRVLLSSGVAVEYDWLVLALGADSVFFGIEGVKEHCIPFCSYPDAMKVLTPLVLCGHATMSSSKPLQLTAAPTPCHTRASH